MKGGQGMGKGTGLDLTHFNFQTLSAVKWS